MNDKVLADTTLGILYGIPQCCIDFYCHSTSYEKKTAASHFAGVITCPACSKLTQSQYVTLVNSNRVCPQTCPDSPLASDLPVIYADARFSAEQVIWLKNNSGRVTPSMGDHDFIAAYRKQYELLSQKRMADIADSPEDEETITSIYKINLATLDNSASTFYYEEAKQNIARQLNQGVLHFNNGKFHY
ncbi:MAG: hypothetical protein ACJA0H_000307 [Francisellaceae bacterium]|jgi:hypothetical protein